jgi:predicted heme/steroid binding protein/uncharacterized membrane protein
MTPAFRKTIRLGACAMGFILWSLCSPAVTGATTDYARQTGFGCGQCHIDAIGGGPLTQAGKDFLVDRKTRGLYRPLSTPQHVVRLIVGYLHMLAAIVWFGTIMYVHILLKPAYASKGLPKGELRLGWLSMVVLLITGVLLTVARVPSLETFTTTRFGMLLAVKIFLYLIMLSSAVVVTIYIGPKLRKQKTLAPVLENGACTPDGLCQFDGRDGRPAYVAYQGVIYDVTKSRLWKNGSHVTKHSAGGDLTDLLGTAPHGEDKILVMPRVGTLLAASDRPRQPFHMKLFYVFAYMNLVLVFVITFVIALWRWW